MQACLDIVLPYVHERQQFGQAIGEFQLIQACSCSFSLASRRLSLNIMTPKLGKQSRTPMAMCVAHELIAVVRAGEASGYVCYNTGGASRPSALATCHPARLPLVTTHAYHLDVSMVCPQQQSVLRRHAARLSTAQQQPPTPARPTARTAPQSSCTRPRQPRGWRWTPYRFVLSRGVQGTNE